MYDFVNIFVPFSSPKAGGIIYQNDAKMTIIIPEVNANNEAVIM